MPPFLLIIILPLILLNKAVLGSQLITAGDFSGSDLVDLHLPFKYTLKESINKSYIALWEEELEAGQVK